MSKCTRKLSALVRPYATYLILAGLAAIIVSVLEQFIPIQVRAVVDASFAGVAPGRAPWRPVLLLGCLLVGSQLLRIAQRLVTEWPTCRIGADLFESGLHHLLSNRMEWFTASHSGAVQVRLERSTRAVAELIKMVLVDMLPPFVGVVLAATLIWRTDAKVGIAAAIAIPVLALLTFWQARSQGGIRVGINKAREEQGVRVAEAVLGIEQVKLFHAELAEARRAGSVSRALSDQEYQHHRAMALFDLAKQWTERMGFAAVLILGLHAASRPGSQLGAGGVLMLVLLYERITEPVRHLHRILDEAGERWILCQDFLRILQADPVPGFATDYAPPGAGEIRCEHVTFAYDAAEGAVLHDLSFHVAPGTRAALVGGSGSGKTTVAKLLTGMYEPDEGHILLGGEPVQPIERARTALRVGMLTQDPHIFSGTVEENICYGRTDATREEIRRAAHVAGIGEVIDLLENGYETLLGQRGAGLSGGQKQRLALARVILQDPDVVIFDEPSSSLDPDNARRFFRTMLEVFANRTVVVITHDLSDLGWADRLVVLDRGRVVETGPPSKLDAPGTAFARLRNGDQHHSSGARP